MSLPDTTRVVQELPRHLRPAFAPLVKRAFGLALGTLAAVGLVLLGVVGMTAPEGDEQLWVWLIGSNFLPGYAPSAIGVAIGAIWGLSIGFVAGWLLAFLRNGLLSFWVAVIGAIERLKASRDILDQM